MRVYLAGKITGDDRYLQKFSMAEAELEAAGHEVVNPAMLSGVMPEGTKWGEYMKIGLTILMGYVDALVLLPDWRESQGACMEYGCAIGRELAVFEFSPEMEDRIKGIHLTEKG